MPETFSSVPHRWPLWETRDRAGYAVLAAICLLAVTYGVFLAGRLPETAMEQAYRAGAGTPVFAAVLRCWTAIAGGGLVGARAFSILMTLIAILATAHLGRRIAGDAPVGACFALGWVVFPPLSAVLSYATPHAAAAALTSVALAVLWPSGHKPRRRAVVAGAVALLMAGLMHPAAAIAAVPLALLGMVVWTGLPQARIAMAALLGVAVIGASQGIMPLGGMPAEDIFLLPPRVGLVDSLLLPYGMVIVAIVMAWAASLSPVVRAVLGGKALWICRAAPLVFGGQLLLATAGVKIFTTAQLLTGAAFFMPIGLLGTLPLVVWTRFAMPLIKNRAVWVLLPVVMYSCFWVILGPVKSTRFPYREVRASQ